MDVVVVGELVVVAQGQLGEAVQLQLGVDWDCFRQRKPSLIQKLVANWEKCIQNHDDGLHLFHYHFLDFRQARW